MRPYFFAFRLSLLFSSLGFFLYFFLLRIIIQNEFHLSNLRTRIGLLFLHSFSFASSSNLDAPGFSLSIFLTILFVGFCSEYKFKRNEQKKTLAYLCERKKHQRFSCELGVWFDGILGIEKLLWIQINFGVISFLWTYPTNIC